MGLSFKQQIIGVVLLAALVPLALVSGIAVYESYVSSRKLAEGGLKGIAEATARQERTLFDIFETRTRVQAHSKAVHEALKDFTAAVNALDAASVQVDEDKLRAYYAAHQQKTPGTKPEDMAGWVPAEARARALQYLYVVQNENPDGEKQKLAAAGDGSEYSRVHARFHPDFRYYVDQFKMKDFLLVDAASGNVVYSDTKGIDFMGNVREGALADSLLGKVVKKVMASNDPDFVAFSEMDPYVPNGNAQSLFVASPIVEDGKTLGALVMQISPEKIQDAFMPLKKVGDTVDGYLIDTDMTLLTPPLSEEGKVGDVAPAGLAEKVQGVLDGKLPEGIHYYKGDDGYPMTGEILKAGIPGLNWAIVVGQDDAEMLASTYTQIYIMLGVAAAVALVMVAVGLAMGGALSRPLQMMALNFQSSAERVGRATSEVGEAVASMVAASEETSTQSKVVRRNSSEASGYVSSVSSAVEELNTSINDISRSIGETNHLIDDAVQKATETDKVVRSLGDASKKITEVVALINDLAEQTNLLALNAAIEAARAGDAGRGFAVVADEVKKLASNTSQATVDIKEQVDGILVVSKQSVEALQTVVDAIHRIRDNATSVSAAVEEQSGVAKQIAGSVKDAAHRVHQVDENMNGIEQAANDTGVAADQVNGSSQEVQSAFDQMKAQMQAVLEKMGIKV